MTSYLPSLSSIKDYVASYASSWLPQNQHTKNVAALTNEIQSLEKSLDEKTGQVFRNKVSETIGAIQTKKQKCIDDLDRMNGSYYQDPKSTLKTNWDKLVKAVETAIGFKIVSADQLDEVSAQLNTDSTETKVSAKEKINFYKTIEKKRNERQSQLNQIIATEKTSSLSGNDLQTKKDLLMQRHQQLCGDYFGDSKGLLDQAWQKYQTAVAHGSTGEVSLASYQDLEKYRKQIEAELCEIEKQLSIPTSNHTYETLTVELITQQIETLKKHKLESDLSGIDLNEIAATTAKKVIFRIDA